MSARVVRGAAVAGLVLDTAGLLLCLPHVVHTDPAPAPPRRVVVDSQCIDGRITQGIDDGDPAGLLAFDTGVSC